MIEFNSESDKRDFIKICLQEGLQTIDKITSGNIAHHKAQLKYILRNALDVCNSLKW